MAAPLASNYREQPLWQAQSPLPETPTETLPTTADAVIVGAGYCGLAAATELARRGRHAVVIEREQLGWGASTRNGGMVIPELKANLTALRQEYGELGARMWGAVNDAFDWTERLIAEEAIDCDYRRSGQLYLAHHPRVAAQLRTAAEPDGDARFIEPEDLGTEIGSEAFFGGLVIGRTGGLQPARYHAGLRARAAEAGAELHDRTAAQAVAPRPSGGFRVSTSRGEIEAGAVIAATNAYADGLTPRLRRRVQPVGSFIIATEPLDATLAAELSPQGRMFVDSKNFLSYWRLSPDGRMVFGGRKSLRPVRVSDARDFLHASMTRIHPQLAGVPIEFAWGGNVAVTWDRLPHFGWTDGVLYATGCNGSGVALNTWMGAQAAGVACGEEPPPFAELDHSRIPLQRLGAVTLPLAGQWFRFRDRYPRR